MHCCWLKSSLDSIVIPDGVVIIGDYVFLLLSIIEIHSNSWGSYHHCRICFQWMWIIESLQLIGIPSGVTTIRSCAYSYFEPLISIEVPDGAIEIRYGASQRVKRSSRLLHIKFLIWKYKKMIWKSHSYFEMSKWLFQVIF